MLKVCRPVTTAFVAVMVIGLIASCDRMETPVDVALNAPIPEFATQQGNDFLITHGNITMKLKPMLGGRVASLKHQSHELLVPESKSDYMLWGSVLWSSPQADWGWPPVAVLDSQPYQVTIEPDELVFTSAVDPKTGYQFERRFAVVPGKEALRLGYRIYNRSDVEKAVAPWEVTRVPPAGITFFPKGEGVIESGIFYPLTVETINGIVWYPYDLKKLQNDHHKLLSDGSEGWLAHTHNGYLFIKQFEDVTPDRIATNEAEIELFANAEKTYIELEQQGEIVTLQTNEYLDWEVIWHIKKLPAGLAASVGSEELVNYVRELVDGVTITQD
jgi:hypothetical protein